MYRFLITGGAGFIGSHLADLLLEENHDVVVLDNFSSGTMDNLAHIEDRIEIVRGDILDFELMQALCSRVDYVFHHAAVSLVGPTISDPLSANEVNVSGTLTVLEAARRGGVRRVVCASSAAVYGNPEGEIRSEDMLPHPESPYAVSKLTVEHYCHVYSALYKLPTVCLRYFNVFGPRQDAESAYASAVSTFVRDMLSGKSPIIHGDGRQSRDFIAVSDVARATLLAALSDDVDYGTAYNVGSGRGTSIVDLVLVVAKVLEIDASPVYEKVREGDVLHSCASLERVEKGLGFTPQVSLFDGLSSFVAWYRFSVRDVAYK